VDGKLRGEPGAEEELAESYRKVTGPTTSCAG
jgi:hypothetical protein